MTKKELYLKLYKRFVKFNHMPIKQVACKEILNGSRLIFGMMVYHHKRAYAEEWLNMICPLFCQDLDFIFEQLHVRKKQLTWDEDKVKKSIKRGDLLQYLKTITQGYFTVDDVFNWYVEALNEEIE